MPQLSPRARIVRDAIIYTPLFALSGVTLLLMVVGIFDRAIIAMFLLAIVAFLFGYQSIQSLRDLAAQPRTVEGTIARRWTKRDAMVAKSHYVTVDRAIYRIPVEDYLDLRESDTIRIVAYPHTGTVVSVERLKTVEPEAPVEPVKKATGRMRMLRTARSTPSARDVSRPDVPGDRSASSPSEESER